MKITLCKTYMLNIIKCTTRKLLKKLEIFVNFVTGSGRIPMSVSMRNCSSCMSPGFHIKVP